MRGIYKLGSSGDIDWDGLESPHQDINLNKFE